MKKLKELVGLLGKRYLPLGDTKSGQQTRQLYLYVRRVAEPTDHGGAKKLGLPKSSAAYRKVKHRLKYALLDGITAVPAQPRKPANRPEASLCCWSSIALANSSRYAYELLPRELIDASIQLSQDYDLLEASSLLTDVLADRPSVGPDIVHYLERSDYLGELGVAMAEVYDASFYIAHLRNSQAPMLTVRDVAARALEKMLPEKSRFKFALWHYHLFVLEINFYLASNNFKKVLRISNEAINFFNSQGELVLKLKYQIAFKIYQINSYIHMGEFKSGESASLELLASVPINSRNYYKMQELLMILCLRAGQFQKGYEYFKEFRLSEVNENIDKFFSETISIFEAYIFLGVALNRVVLADGDDRFVKFRIKRFLNNFEYITKEKSARNIQVVILRLVFNLLRKEKEDFDFKNEFADKYMRRHMNRDSYKRSRFFIAGIRYIGSNGITRESAKIASQRYIKRLDELPFQEVHQDSYSEIVPYELLWRLIIEHYGIKPELKY